MTVDPGSARRASVRHTIELDLPLERTMHLFTPVSERLWVDGWNPTFPAGEEGDGSAPGTVFVTDGAHALADGRI